LEELSPKQHLSLTYEELCDKTEETIEKMIKFLPELGSLDPLISEVKGISNANQRSEKITNMNRPRDVPQRSKVLGEYPELLKTFGYEIQN
jgi:hypothetical protein